MVISKLQYRSIEQIVESFLQQGKEGECWDFKQEWHENMPDLIKDIICFANTVHDENCYLIFGVADDLQIEGMKKERRKQADIIDAISKLTFAGDVYPKIEVETIQLAGHELDILIVFNTAKTPIYLKKSYGNMKKGCIYLRNGDRNTPDNENADITDIENLWRKRLGLTKPPFEYILDRMHNKLEWKESNGYYYNIYQPEYTIQIIQCEDHYAEFYAYTMINPVVSYELLNIIYRNTVLESYQLVALDSRRLRVPTPEMAFICHDGYSMSSEYSYRYYIKESNQYRILSFLYDPDNKDERYTFERLKNVVLIYQSLEEKDAFESFVKNNQYMVDRYLRRVDKYNGVVAGDETRTKVFRERLRLGVALNELLIDLRAKKIDMSDNI